MSDQTPHHDPPHEPDPSRTRLTLLWTRAQPSVMAFVRSMVPNPVDAEDVLQQTAYEIATNFEEYDDERPFIAWAIGIARYKVLDYRRDRGRGRMVLTGDAIEHLANAYIDQSEALNANSRALQECLDKLSDKARSLIELRYTQDLKPAAIAQRVGTSPNVVSNALSRAREVLRNCIERTRSQEEAR